VGWGSFNGLTATLDGKKLDEVKAQVHLRRLLLLVHLLEDKSYELTALDEIKVNDISAIGVKVTAKGQRDVKLYFDKNTGLLAKIEWHIFEDGANKEVLEEQFPSDYKEIDGLKTAMKEVWHRAGKKVLEMAYSEVKYREKIDAQEFVKPAVSGVLDKLPATHAGDVIYGRKFGTALTMDVFTPKKDANGAAIILVVSGGWISDSEFLNSGLFTLFLGEPLKRGYTVFAVVHGSQPKFTIPEAIADINRAVRFIRYHAKDYQIDADRIGITGASAGGHLALMQGTAGDAGNPKASEPVERVSSRVQAVACLYPPTDFLNYGDKGRYAFAADGLLAAFRTAIDVREFDAKTGLLERLDEKKAKELARKISPITHVTAASPPTLIIHGDADKIVPIQQSEAIMARFKEAGVTAELVVRKGRGHDFANGDKDVAAMTDWFDKHLGKK
jgi:acetyl esterase/lipase